MLPTGNFISVREVDVDEHKLPRGLTQKFVVYSHRMPELIKEGAFKAEFAYDDDGRLWRRLTREDSRYRSRHGQKYTRTTPWHVADMYTWFPADTVPEIARKSNKLARLPKKFERFVTTKGERIEVDRPIEPQPPKKRGRPRKLG